MRVSWPQSAAAARNDIALKIMASEPNAAGSIYREASANIARPSTEAVNLMTAQSLLQYRDQRRLLGPVVHDLAAKEFFAPPAADSSQILRL